MQSNVRQCDRRLGGRGLALALLLAGCGGFGARGESAASAPASPIPLAPEGVSDSSVKIGPPYQVGGTTYTPADTLNYDEVGYAGVYGPALDGSATASGEPFNPQAVTAAHKTLPLPSYVEVTSIETGRTILVRINDRGPFSNDRLIDLSQGAARQLGIEGKGAVGVRVRRVNPPEHERAMLRGGGQAAERLETPPGLRRALARKLGELPAATAAAAPAPAAPPRAAPAPATAAGPAAPGATYPVPGRGGERPAPPPGPAASAQVPQAPAATAPAPVQGRGWYVQAAAFSTRARADAAAKRLGAGVYPAGSIFRVRLGPYGSEGEARAGVAKARAQGYSDARIFRE